MPRFEKSNAAELKRFLYNSCVHDARMENIVYRCGDDCMKIELLNPIFNTRLLLIFSDIEVVLAVKKKEYGSHETIISLSMEEDLSYLQNYFPKCTEYAEDNLYLLFQMFSGDELHIVSKEVTIEIVA